MPRPSYYLRVDSSWLVVGQHKTKEAFRDKNAHLAQGATIMHNGKGVTLVEEPFEAKKDLEDDLPPLIDLENDLPSLIDLIPVGKLLEEVVGDQNSPNYHLLLEEVLTNENTTNYCLLSKEVVEHQQTKNYHLLFEKVVAH